MPRSTPRWRRSAKSIAGVAIAIAILGIAAVVHRSRKSQPSPQDLAAQLTATVSADPARITLTWQPNPRDVTEIAVYRKAADAQSFGPPIADKLAPTTTRYVDEDVKRGVAYDYYISRTLSADPWLSSGAVRSGIEVPLADDPGSVVLVIEASVASPLSAEIDRLERDLEGEGFGVARAVVPAGATPPEVKEKIKALHDAAPDRLRYAMLIGHVPVPYSGNHAPDGHRDPAIGPVHVGAWPADLYYGDLHGSWTDTTVDTTKNPYPPADPINSNVPGDGKFDPTFAGNGWRPVRHGPLRLAAQPQGTVDLAVGRVDLSDMPAFLPKTEIDLLRAYLDKDHRFRHRELTADEAGIIDDHFGFRPAAKDQLFGDAPATPAYNAFTAMFGPSRVTAAPLLDRSTPDRVLFAYGCGGGQQTSCDGIGTTSDVARKDPRAIFTIVYGSYFGDWNHRDNFLRAQIATGAGLAAGWGMPPWILEPLALGDTIGDCLRITETSFAPIHLGLMGDPTLRLRVVAPPTDLSASPSPGGTSLRWKPSAEPVIGYHVYRSPERGQPWTRITANPLPATDLVDPSPAPAGARYLVRAVKLEITPSGSYFNASEGAIADAPTPAAPPPPPSARPPAPRRP